jgi:hypothetical protein
MSGACLVVPGERCYIRKSITYFIQYIVTRFFLALSRFRVLHRKIIYDSINHERPNECRASWIDIARRLN